MAEKKNQELYVGGYVCVGGWRDRESGLECRWCRLVFAEQAKQAWTRVSHCVYVCRVSHTAKLDTYLDWSKLSKKDGRC